MEWYVSLVQKYPIYMAMIQFAILGTLGGFVAKWIQAKKVFLPFSVKECLWVALVWAFYGVLIKVAFAGFPHFVNGIVAEGFLPAAFGADGNRLLYGFSISVIMNLQFGLFLVISHRFLDHLPFRKTVWTNIDKGVYSLLWWWIPAHTVTFVIPPDYRIGLAALYSVVLGFILGIFNKAKK